MDVNWITDFAKTSNNAFTADWFVSPLEYSWGDGKNIFDKAFRAPSTANANFDEHLAPQLFRTSMQVDFRAKMMVYAFMRESIAKTYSLEIESGLMSLYRLDFLSCLSQWIYVVEGYCRQLLQVPCLTNVRSTLWSIPTTGDMTLDGTIGAVCKALGDFLDKLLYESTNDFQTTRLNRHLLAHGNLQNKAFFSQKNCLSLMFVLDALVLVEMVKNLHFPVFLQNQPGESDRVDQRKAVYMCELEHAFFPQNLLKRQLLDEHV
jgi:hypothetical protein